MFVGHLISFISRENKIHEIKCQWKYLFPLHLTGFIENPRNLMPTNLLLIWNPRNFKPTKINDSTVLQFLHLIRFSQSVRLTHFLVKYIFQNAV